MIERDTTIARVLDEHPAQPLPASATPGAVAGEAGTMPRPAALDAVPASCVVHVDVRVDIARGVEPLARIMRAVKELEPGQVLALRAPFEPIPLYRVLGPRGFAHWTTRRASDDWDVWFYRSQVVSVTTPSRDAAAEAAPVMLDVRELEPPLPMVKVLERLDTLAAGQTLTVLHSRRPLFLYPHLDERGFTHETDEPEPGVVRIRIRRPTAGA